MVNMDKFQKILYSILILGFFLLIQLPKIKASVIKIVMIWVFWILSDPDSKLGCGILIFESSEVKAEFEREFSGLELELPDPALT